jgi:hypothetical protein
VFSLDILSHRMSVIAISQQLVKMNLVLFRGRYGRSHCGDRPNNIAATDLGGEAEHRRFWHWLFFPELSSSFSSRCPKNRLVVRRDDGCRKLCHC